jgi:hypothetical protein
MTTWDCVRRAFFAGNPDDEIMEATPSPGKRVRRGATPAGRG